MMFRSAWASICLSSRSRLIFGTTLLFALLCTPPVRAQVVAQYGFEDGTTEGWTSFNGARAPVNSTAAAHNEIAGPPGGPQDNSGISTTFEDGGLDGWSSRAGAALANSTADAHGGTHSLLVTNRVAAYDGPQISVDNKMYNGSAYSISVWVKLAPSATQSDTLRVSLQTTLAGTTTYHTVVNNTAVPLGTWVQLSIPNYAMGFAYDPGKAFLYVESGSGTQSFYIDDFQLTFIPPVVIQKDIPSIYQTLSQYFPVGAAVDPTDLSGPHAELLTKHFNSIVSGNDMKWDATEPQEGHFTFTTADSEVSFAVAHSMLIRGHNLVWATGAQTPAWVFREADGVTPLSASNPADVSLLTQRIQNHIMNEVTHFGSAIYVWDVINEPLDPNQPDCLAHGPFYQVLGSPHAEFDLRVPWRSATYETGTLVLEDQHP